MDETTLVLFGLLGIGGFLIFQQMQKGSSGGGSGSGSTPIVNESPSAGSVIGSTINGWFGWDGEVF